MGISPSNIRKMEEDSMLRIDWAIPLVFDTAGHLLRDTIAELDLKQVESLFGKNKYLKESWEEDDKDSMIQWIKENCYDLILVHVSTPVMHGKMFSWGNYYTVYLTVKSLDDAVTEGFKWKEKVNKIDKKKAKDNGTDKKAR